MKNKYIANGILLVIFMTMMSFCTSLFASDAIQIDTILTDKMTADNNAGEPKDVMSPDTPAIYVFWKSDQLKDGQKLKSVWIADDTNNVAPANYKIDEATFELNKDFKDKMLSSLPGSYWGGKFDVTKPTSGWPVGKYHVDIYVDDALVKTINFTVAKAGATSQAAAPAASAEPVVAAPAAPVVAATTAAVVSAPTTKPAASDDLSTVPNTWGAISIDQAVVNETSPYYGTGGGNTKELAEKSADRFCVEAGGKQCKVVISYQTCGAYAASSQSSGAGTGVTKKASEDDAISHCKSGDCKIVISDCNS
jgi:hypothetical protein